MTSEKGMEGVESWRRKGQIMSEKEVCLMCENYSEAHERKRGKTND